MCVMSFLCGPRADLWPFYGFLHTTLYTLYYTSRGDRPPDFENYSAGPDERNSSLSTFSRNRNKFATVTYSEPERLCFMRTVKGTVPVKARKEASKHFFLLSNKWQNCQC